MRSGLLSALAGVFGPAAVRTAALAIDGAVVDERHRLADGEVRPARMSSGIEGIDAADPACDHASLGRKFFERRLTYGAPLYLGTPGFRTRLSHESKKNVQERCPRISTR